MLLGVFLVSALCSSARAALPPEQSSWVQNNHEELEANLRMSPNTNQAKNVVVFIGDGMGPNTITAARIYRAGESSYLSWERFPHMAAVKTYCANKQVPDSGSTATAIFTGVKVNYRTLGVDSTVAEKNCSSSLKEESWLTSIGALAQRAGKSTGIVTTTRVTHATPAAMYAHTSDRDWECWVPEDAIGCKDIGRMLVEDEPGKYFNVILGGGRQILKANSTDYPWDRINIYDDNPCVRNDGRDLISEWAQAKATQGVKYAVVDNKESLLNINTMETDYLLGIFSNDHMPYDYQRNSSTRSPTLEEMTVAALKILTKEENGFLLMVEGGLIDKAHHAGKARAALQEVLGLNDAINATMRFLESAGIDDETLVIVTSDHSHTLSISGYPALGTSILGLADVSKADSIPYTTLGYANSGKNNYHYTVLNGAVVRKDPSKVDTTSYEYGPQAGVLQDKNSHGGNDVFVYAAGPFAHLFRHMHEQTYIATVIKYAAKLGEYNTTDNEISSSSTISLSFVIGSICLIFLSIVQ